MGTQAPFRPEVWEVFRDDAARILGELEASLLRLEQDPARHDELMRISRDLHTLKGGAGFLELAAVTSLAHAAEELVVRLESRQVPLDSGAVSVLLDVLDTLRQVIDESAEGPVAGHLDRIEPLRAELLARAEPGRPVDLPDLANLRRVGLAEAAELSGRLSRALLASMGAPGSGPWVPAPPLADALGGLRHLAACTGSEAYGAAVRRFLEELPTGRPGLLRLTWQLAHREVEHLASAGTVLFDDSDAPPARGDPACVAALEGALVELRDGVRAGDASDLATLRTLGERFGHAGLVEAIEAVVAAGPELREGRYEALLGASRELAGRPAARSSDARPKGRSTRFLRVEQDKVANLMSLAGEIGLAVGSVFNLGAVRRELENEDVRIAVDRVESLIRELQDSSASLGLVPLSTAFGRMNRVVRDLSHRTGKSVALTSEGGDTEIDKLLVDGLIEPLIHLVRNAIDHGIETPGEREAAGKSGPGQVRLSARNRGEYVIVSVRDDGRGMDRAAILRHAVAAGLVDAESADELTDQQVWDLVFTHGFTTTSEVSDISWRGVGMEVVKASVHAFGGRVTVRTQPGRGTAVHLMLPLTLAFLDGMVVRVGRCNYVLPVSAVSRVFRVEAGDVERVDAEDVDLIRVGRQLVPALCLEQFYAEAEPAVENYVGRTVVVVRTARGRLALPIDELLGHEQVTMKPLTGQLSRIRASAGCGLLRSGDVAIALNCERLHELAHAGGDLPRSEGER